MQQTKASSGTVDVCIPSVEGSPANLTPNLGADLTVEYYCHPARPFMLVMVAKWADSSTKQYSSFEMHSFELSGRPTLLCDPYFIVGDLQCSNFIEKYMVRDYCRATLVASHGGRRSDSVIVIKVYLITPSALILTARHVIYHKAVVFFSEVGILRHDCTIFNTCLYFIWYRHEKWKRVGIMQVSVAPRESGDETISGATSGAMTAFYLESLTWSRQVHNDLVLGIVHEKGDTQCGSMVCQCKEPSGQPVWEEPEEVRYVAGYLERGHLAWLSDNSPTARRAAMSQVLMQSHYHGNRDNE